MLELIRESDRFPRFRGRSPKLPNTFNYSRATSDIFIIRPNIPTRIRQQSWFRNYTKKPPYSDSHIAFLFPPAIVPRQSCDSIARGAKLAKMAGVKCEKWIGNLLHFSATTFRRLASKFNLAAWPEKVSHWNDAFSINNKEQHLYEEKVQTN